MKNTNEILIGFDLRVDPFCSLHAHAEMLPSDYLLKEDALYPLPADYRIWWRIEDESIIRILFILDRVVLSIIQNEFNA